MVLAHTVKLDVLHHHHLVDLLVEQCAVDDALDVGLVAAGQESERLLSAVRRANQAFARGILADLDQDLLHHRSDGFFVQLRLHHFHNGFVLLHRLQLVLNSNRFRLVSCKRMPSRRGQSPGKVLRQPALKRLSITRRMFSEVGTRSPENSGTSALKYRWSKSRRICSLTKRSNA